MKIIEKIKIDLKLAIKCSAKEKRDNIRVILGEIQRDKNKKTNDKVVIEALKKLRKSETTLLNTSGKESSDFLEQVEKYLPSIVTEEELENFIKTIDFSLYKEPMLVFREIKEFLSDRLIDGNMAKEIILKNHTK